MKMVAPIFALAAFLLAACAPQSIYNVTDHPIPARAQSLSIVDIEKLIIEGGQQRGWRFETVAPGRLRAMQDQPKYAAQVDITFNQKSFSIRHVSSRGMKEKGDTIHPHYNFWIRNLEHDIATRLANAAATAR